MSDRTLLRTRIMVPLDGSELAERALPAATHIAAALDAPLTLVRITPPFKIPPGAWDEIASAKLSQTMVDEAARAAEAYLEEVAQPLRERNLTVQTVTAQGVAAPRLIDLLARLHIGLVVMTTHGRAGMARIALGSVADQLVRESHVPVLLLRPLIEERECECLDRALVPLDGSELAESALDLVVALSGTLIQTITLLQVVPMRDGHATVRRMEEAERYMEQVFRRLTGLLDGRATVETRVVTGEPADQIRRRTDGVCDVVIMATHGDTGMRKWAFGSVADRVLHDTPTPLILIQPLRSAQQRVGQQEAAVGQTPGNQV